MRRSIGLVAAIILLFSSIDSLAAFLELGSEYGPNSVTLDIETGIEWLDVTQSVNMSVLDVEAELLFGGEYFGWRYATGEEIEILFYSSAGLPSNEFARVSDAPLYQEFHRLFGITADVGTANCRFCGHFLFAYNATQTSPEARQLSVVNVNWDSGAISEVYSSVEGGAGLVTARSQIIGHWLVRNSGEVGTEHSTWGSIKAMYR